MPDIATHAAATAAKSTATSMVSLAAIGSALGLDPAALFWAFMGAVCWRAVQPRIAPTFDEISRAFGWATMAMIFGSLGSVVAVTIIMAKFDLTRGVHEPALLGLTATLLGFFCTPFLLKIGELIKHWRAPKKWQ